MSKQTISRSELLGLLLTTRGAKICKISYQTDARLRKTANPHPLVNKTVEINAICNYRYKEALEKRLAQIGEEPSAAKSVHPRTWGQAVEGTPVVEYQEKYYFNVMINRVLSTSYKDAQSGKDLTFDDVKDFLPNKDSSLVKVANIGLDKIQKVKLGGVEYEIL